MVVRVLREIELDRPQTVFFYGRRPPSRVENRKELLIFLDFLRLSF